MALEGAQTDGDFLTKGEAIRRECFALQWLESAFDWGEPTVVYWFVPECRKGVAVTQAAHGAEPSVRGAFVSDPETTAG